MMSLIGFLIFFSNEPLGKKRTSKDLILKVLYLESGHLE